MPADVGLHRSPGMLRAFLARYREQIIERCERAYRERNPEWPRDELLNTIPVIIDGVIEAKLPDCTDDARVFAEQQFRRGLRIGDVVTDYATISRAIGDIAIEQHVQLDARSYNILNECLDAAIARAITTYHELAGRRDHEQIAQWLGTLAHELRNSLTTAIMSYGCLRTGEVGLDSRTARLLERSLNQLEVLVSQALTAAKLSSGVPPSFEPIDVAELIADVDAGVLHERGIRVELAIEHGLTLVGDPRLLASALTNLLQNAIKFTHGGGRVQIRAHRNKAGVVIEIEDECGGLDAPLDALLLPWVQRAPDRRGIGLGLAITRDAVVAHGGTLGATDLPGRGCIFRVVLPP